MSSVNLSISNALATATAFAGDSH